MPSPLHAVVLKAQGESGDDRAAVFEVGDGLVIAVADGAGGVLGSARAAEAVVSGVGAAVARGASPDDAAAWAGLLAETDLAIHRAGGRGQATAVVLAVTGRWICGASVGDSEAWLATVDDFRHLTAGQDPRPLIGSGSARPVPFRRRHSGGAVVVGTDGLFRFAPAWRICQVAASHPPEVAARTLLGLVRLPDGGLRDDVGFVVCGLASPPDAGRGEE